MTTHRTHLEPACVENFVQFCAARGLVDDAQLLGHIHAGLRSAPQTKTWRNWYAQESRRLHTACEESHAAYEAAIKAGQVSAPAKPSLKQIAAGHPDNPSVQAAQRALARRQAVMESLTTEPFGNSEQLRFEPSGNSGQLPEPARIARDERTTQ